ncbi:MAG: cytochrome B6, partial [Candidatus Kryptoniota bacterium]
SSTPVVAKAPWYFLWLQELVSDTTIRIGNIAISGGFIGGILIPAALLILLAAWPWLDKSSADAVGVWFHKSRTRQNVVFLVIVILLVILILIGTFMRGPVWRFYWPWESWPEPPTVF